MRHIFSKHILTCCQHTCDSDAHLFNFCCDIMCAHLGGVGCRTHTVTLHALHTRTHHTITSHTSHTSDTHSHTADTSPIDCLSWNPYWCVGAHRSRTKQRKTRIMRSWSWVPEKPCKMAISTTHAPRRKRLCTEETCPLQCAHDRHLDARKTEARQIPRFRALCRQCKTRPKQKPPP